MTWHLISNYSFCTVSMQLNLYMKSKKETITNDDAIGSNYIIL